MCLSHLTFAPIPFTYVKVKKKPQIREKQSTEDINWALENKHMHADKETDMGCIWKVMCKVPVSNINKRKTTWEQTIYIVSVDK